MASYTRREHEAKAFEQDLGKNPANYAPLTPLSFLERAAYVYPERISVIHGAQRYTWKETYARCRRLASALAKRGIGVGDTVAVMLPNIPSMFEAHFGVPMCGAVLNTLNTRLDAEAIAFMLEHGEAKLLITDPEFAGVSSAEAGTEEHRVETRVSRWKRLGEGLRGAAGGGRPGVRLALAAGRVGGDLAQLHLRHHRQPEGRGLPPPRRLPERRRQHPGLGHAAPRGVPVDAADVPLQRLVLSVDHGGECRDQRLSAPGRGSADLRSDPKAQGHALLRRADRAPDADQRARGAEARHRRTR